MQKTVKVSFGNDVRRIAIPEGTTFNELLEEIKEILPIPQGYTLKYKDDEGDLITISTDRELEEAFCMEPEAVLRLVVVDSSKREPYKKLKELVLKFVLPAVQEAKRNFEQAEGAETIDDTLALPEVPQQPVDKLALPPLEDELDTTTTEETPTEDIYHEAYCNHCGHDIYNLRYKCANCDDFDLCEECELAWSSDFSIHDISHVFLKLYRPISPSYTTAFLSQNLYEEEHKEEEEDEEESDSSESDSSSSDEEDEEEDTESSSESESDESEESEDDKFELPEVKDTEVSEVDAASLEEDAENVVTEENLIEASHEEEEDEQADEKEEQEEEEQEKETPAPTTESEPKKKESSGFFRALQRFFAMADESKFSREEYEAFLVDMGFSDKERNIKLLEQSDDNIHDVLDQLVA